MARGRKGLLYVTEVGTHNAVWQVGTHLALCASVGLTSMYVHCGDLYLGAWGIPRVLNSHGRTSFAHSGLGTAIQRPTDEQSVP